MDQKANSERLKKEIEKFWTKNLPGLEIDIKDFSLDEIDFYLEVDEFRYRYEPYISELIDSFAEEKKLILEIGCGLGADSRYMARKGSIVVSLDLPHRNVVISMKGMRLFGLDGQGVCADAENLPFKDGSFDGVYSFGVLHHTPNTRKAIQEIHRVLKLGCKCAVMLYHKGYAYYLILLLYGWQRFCKGRSLEQITSER